MRIRTARTPWEALTAQQRDEISSAGAVRLGTGMDDDTDPSVLQFDDHRLAGSIDAVTAAAAVHGITFDVLIAEVPD